MEITSCNRAEIFFALASWALWQLCAIPALKSLCSGLSCGEVAVCRKQPMLIDAVQRLSLYTVLTFLYKLKLWMARELVVVATKIFAFTPPWICSTGINNIGLGESIWDGKATLTYLRRDKQEERCLENPSTVAAVDGLLVFLVAELTLLILLNYNKILHSNACKMNKIALLVWQTYSFLFLFLSFAWHFLQSVFFIMIRLPNCYSPTATKSTSKY